MMDTQSIIDSMKWEPPQKVQGRLVMRAMPTQEFWQLWKLAKDSLKRSGIHVTKEGSVYVVWRWLTTTTVYAESREVVRKVKALRSHEGLLNYQRAHTVALVNAVRLYGCALDGSDTGTGKSYTALAVCRELQMTPFVICPKSAITMWKRVGQHMGYKNLTAINYEKLKTWNTEYVVVNSGDKKSRDAIGLYKWLLPVEDTLIIFDEVHRCKNYKSINSDMLISAVKQNYKILGLSATVADNPLQMKAIGFMLGLFPRERDFWGWIQNYACWRGRFGYEFRGDDKVLQRLHALIYPAHGSRMRIKDLGDAFPSNQIVAAPYTMDTAGEIQKVYDELRESLEELALKSELDGASELTVILRARQRVELLKVPTFVEMAQDFIEDGLSVVIFVNFHETLELLASKLETDCVIHGKQVGSKGAQERQHNIDRFMADESRIIICNIKAGGESISLHDKSGRYRRVSLISPTWSAQELIQALGRIHRAGSQSPALQRIIFAAGTVEERVADAVMQKVDRIKLLNDGDLMRGLDIACLNRNENTQEDTYGNHN